MHQLIHFFQPWGRDGVGGGIFPNIFTPAKIFKRMPNLLAVVVGSIFPDDKNIDVDGQEELGQLLHRLRLDLAHRLL
jgi:hypothetical protein